jgi:hypothetical protein
MIGAEVRDGPMHQATLPSFFRSAFSTPERGYEKRTSVQSHKAGLVNGELLMNRMHIYHSKLS